MALLRIFAARNSFIFFEAESSDVSKYFVFNESGQGGGGGGTRSGRTGHILNRGHTSHCTSLWAVVSNVEFGRGKA
jgi:hypothetical protein